MDDKSDLMHHVERTAANVNDGEACRKPGLHVGLRSVLHRLSNQSFGLTQNHMIISHKYRFAFIHIPKCAGTTVRVPLQALDDTVGAFTARVGDHPALGKLDYVHIPLFTLSKFFQRELTCIRDYWSFAVVRNPYSRFASSVSQRLNWYTPQPIYKCEINDVRKAIRESIEYLKQQPTSGHLLPPEYIHFQKQVDYIILDGKQLVKSLYTMHDVNLLLAHVEKRVKQLSGREFKAYGSVPHANRSVVFRGGPLRWTYEAMRPATKKIGRVLPDRLKQRIHEKVFVPRDKRMGVLFATDYVQNFIGEYYAEDIALYERISNPERTTSE